VNHTKPYFFTKKDGLFQRHKIFGILHIIISLKQESGTQEREKKGRNEKKELSSDSSCRTGNDLDSLWQA